MNRLDDFELKNVDFIKVDVEGYEYFVISGAIETITRCRPVIIVEQKAGFERYGLSDKQAVALLKSLGYVEKEVLVGDHIMVPQ